jgi:hypothetical protein
VRIENLLRTDKKQSKEEEEEEDTMVLGFALAGGIPCAKARGCGWGGGESESADKFWSVKLKRIGRISVRRKMPICAE